MDCLHCVKSGVLAAQKMFAYHVMPCPGTDSEINHGQPCFGSAFKLAAWWQGGCYMQHFGVLAVGVLCMLHTASAARTICCRKGYTETARKGCFGSQILHMFMVTLLAVATNLWWHRLAGVQAFLLQF